MKQIITIFVLLYSVCIDNTFGQNQNYLFKDSKTPFIANLKISPFSISNTRNLNFSNLFKDGGYTPIVLNINQTEVAKIKKSDVFIELSIPDNSKSELVLELVQVDFFGPDFKVVDGNGSSIVFEKGLYYHGRIKGDNNSMVALSISKSEIAGLITDKNGSRSLGKIKDQNQYSLNYDNQFKEQKNFDCTTTESNSTPIPFGQLQPQAVVACKATYIYIETDYSIYQNFNNDAQATSTWATTLFNQVFLMYRNDNIGITLSQLKVWTVSDPYAGTTNTEDFVNTFHNYIYQSYYGNLAQVLSMRDLRGGRAYTIGGICDKPNSQSVSTSLSKYYGSLPYYSWNVNVITHELGHSFGSRHTHACVWNGNGTAIDGCGPTYGPDLNPPVTYEGNCSGAPIPSNGGTVMSYCHLGNVGINPLNGFGPQPGNYIRNIVNNCSLIAVDNTSPTNLTSSSIGYTSATVSWNLPVTSTNFTISYRRVGEINWSTVSSGTSNTYTFSGLYTGTQYEWTVAGDCSAGGTYPYAYFTTTSNLALSFTDISEYKCSGNNTLTFSPSGIINPDTQVQLELSNANGSFVSPSVLGTQLLTSTGSNTIFSFVLPFGMPAGAGYKIRLKASSPNVISTAIDLEIKPSQPSPQYTYSSQPFFCNSNPITISVVNCTGTVTWYSSTFSEQTGSSVTIIPSDGLYVSSVCRGNNLCSSQTTNTQVFKKVNTGTKNSIVLWEKSFGGTADDQFRNVTKTADGGYLLTGYSASGLNGNRAQPQRGGGDGILIKIDANGNRLWEKAFGGVNEDYLFDILPTSDNNFLIVGHSFSGVGYEKQSINKGDVDGWIIKINPNGDVIWEVSLGSTAGEYTGKVAPTADGGFIIVSSVGSTGLASVAANGDRSQSLKSNSWDYWIFKINANGQKVWDKVYGGISQEFVFDIEKATDNSGYYIVGQTNSGTGSDVSTSARHDYDGWLLKIDNNGNKIFDKTFSGGTARSPFATADFSNESLRKIKALPDGNYLIQGFSNNHAGNEKSENSMGGLDMWLIKIAPDGTKISDKVFGGSNNEFEGDMIVLNDGNILLSSSSKSLFNVDKNDALKGISDVWMLKLDPNLNIIWSENFGGAVGNDPAKQETIYKILNDGNDNFILAGWANEAKGDRANAFGLDDAWVMKVNIPAFTKPTITASTALICPGESITLTVNGCNRDVLWSTGAVSNSILVKPNSDENTYKVNCITNANACIGTDSDVFRVSVSASDLNLTGTAISGNKQAKNTIVSHEIINNTVNVTYKAGKSILLDRNQSFEAKAGSIFKAEIAACNLEQGMVGYYPFNGNVQDVSGNTRHGILTEALFTKDRFGKSNSALSFDGINDKVSLNYTYSGYQELTVSAWVNVKDLANNWQSILSANGSEFSYFQLHQGSGAILGVYTSATQNAVSNNYVQMSSVLPYNPKNAWVHILMKIKSGDSKLFLNGQVISTSTQAFNYITATNLLKIGNGFGDGRYFKGEIDDLRMYNRTLTDAEVVSLYQSEAPNPSLSAGLFVNYKFDGSGKDFSGKGNDGTLNGGSTFTTDRFGQANKALNFDGIDDYVGVLNNPTLSGFNEITMSAWLNHSQLSGTLGSIIAKWYQETGKDTYITSVTSNKVYGTTNNISSGQPLEAINPVPQNTWFQLTFTHDSSGDKLFVNGQILATNALSGNVIYSIPNLLIGADSNLGTLWRFYKGKMDDVRLYNRALSPLEVIQLYDLEKP